MDTNLLKDIAGVPLSYSRMEILNNPELWVTSIRGILGSSIHLIIHLMNLGLNNPNLLVFQ
jgi:hypothetical protein